MYAHYGQFGDEEKTDEFGSEESDIAPDEFLARYDYIESDNSVYAVVPVDGKAFFEARSKRKMKRKRKRKRILPSKQQR